MKSLASVGALRGTDRARLALAVALAAGAAGAAIALLTTSGYLISRAAQRPQVIALMVTIVAVRAFGIARAGLRYSERLASHDVALRQLARLRVRCFDRLVPLIPGGVQRRGRGDLLARFVSDIDSLSDLYLRVLIPLLVAAAVIAGSALAAALMLPMLGLVLAAALLLDATVSGFVADRVTRAATRRHAPLRAALTEQLIETIDGSTELALAGRADDAARRLGALDRELGRGSRRDAVAAALGDVTHGLLSGAGLIAVLIVGTVAVHDHTMSGLLLAAAVFLYLGARESVAPVARAMQRARATATTAGRIDELLSGAAPVWDPPQPLALTGGGPLVAEEVTLRYGPAESAVLHGCSLRLEPGEHVALLGASGAGKTTLAELLVRFRDPQRGRVTLDGIDVRGLCQSDLREAVQLCGQDAHVFNTSLRANLLIADPAADPQTLWSALELVELRDWALSLPRGLETIVGQFGELVSGGQRQRIALARAALSAGRFLILDEPTAHLDEELAARVLDGLLDRGRDQGVLVITHDDRDLARFDRVLSIVDGRIGPLPSTDPIGPAADGGAWSAMPG